MLPTASPQKGMLAEASPGGSQGRGSNVLVSAGGLEGALLDVCVQRYNNTPFMAVYVRPMTANIVPDLQHVSQRETYRFPARASSELYNQVMSVLKGIGWMQDPLLGIIGSQLLNKREEYLQEGVYQECCGFMEKQAVVKGLRPLLPG